jgi:hypothetical protein
MNSNDVVGYYPPDSGYVLCPLHGNDKTDQPIFADSEWDSFPACDVCKDMLDVALTTDGIEYYLKRAQDTPDSKRDCLQCGREFYPQIEQGYDDNCFCSEACYFYFWTVEQE